MSPAFSAGTVFLMIVFVSFIFFATQWGSSRGPGSVQKDFVYLFLFLGVGLMLMLVWGGHVAVLR